MIKGMVIGLRSCWAGLRSRSPKVVLAAAAPASIVSLPAGAADVLPARQEQRRTRCLQSLCSCPNSAAAQDASRSGSAPARPWSACRKGSGSTRTAHEIPAERMRATAFEAAPLDARRLAAAAVGPGEDLQQVTVRVFEVHAAAAIPVVDHARLGPARIGPVPQALGADPAKGRVEVFLTN